MSAQQELSRQILREVIIPEIEKEVNQGENIFPGEEEVLFFRTRSPRWEQTDPLTSDIGAIFRVPDGVAGASADEISNENNIRSFVLRVQVFM